EQYRLALALPDAKQKLLHERARLVVERAERLIEQKNCRIVGERARNRGALLHSAGELFGIVLRKIGETNVREPFVHDLCALARRYAFLAQPECDVVGHRKPGKKRVGLEHHAAVGTGRADRLAIQKYEPGGRLIEPPDRPQQGGCTAAGRTNDGDEIIVGDFQIDRLERACRQTPAHGRENPGKILDDELAQPKLQGNSRWFAPLKRKSEISPMMPMTMIPKMICPVAS